MRSALYVSRFIHSFTYFTEHLLYARPFNKTCKFCKLTISTVFPYKRLSFKIGAKEELQCCFMYTRSQPTGASFQLLMRRQRAATYHTRYQKSQLKHKLLGKTTCKSSTSSSGEGVGDFSPGPKRSRGGTRGRNALDASG